MAGTGERRIGPEWWVYLDHVEFSDNLENIEDPGFVDAANQDFRLRDDSAVLKLPGRGRIPIERIGLYKNEYRAD